MPRGSPRALASLRDPEPNNVNFIHPTTGEEYNHRAAETRTWVDLRNGLTQAAVENLVWGITGTKP